MFHTHCSFVQAALWYLGFSVLSAFCLSYPLAPWALSYLCSNLLCQTSSISVVQIITGGGNMVFCELCCPEHHKRVASLQACTHMENLFSPLIMSRGNKGEESIKRHRSEALRCRHFRSLRCLITISKINARWVRRRGEITAIKVCKVFHNKMENNKNSGIYSRHSLLGDMLHTSLKLFHRQSFCKTKKKKKKHHSNLLGSFAWG